MTHEGAPLAAPRDPGSGANGAAASSPPGGYKVVLPPGWEQIPLKEGTRETIRKIVDRVFAHPPEGVPRDKLTPLRIDLERRLSDVASQARRNGGIHLYLPVTLRHSTPIAASFVVSEGSLGSLEDIDPAMVVSYLASEDGGEEDGKRTATVDGAVSLRLENTAPANPAKGADYGSRRVDYVVPVPGEQDRWMVIAFSTLGGGDPDDRYALILVDLFDAIMSTFRWTQADDSAGRRRE